MALTRPKYSSIVDTDYKASCRVITTTNITLSGAAPSTYDGVTLIAGDRVLVNAQTTSSQNGIYIVQTLGTGANGTWIRSPDANQSAYVTAGMRTFIGEGTYAGTEYRLLTPDPITLGTTSLSFQSTAATVSGISKSVQYNNAGFIAGAAYLTYDNTNGNLVIASSTPSTSTTTGVLVVGGGMGVSGNIYSSGNVVATGVGLSSFAGSMSVAGVATFNSNVVIVGNLTTLGNTFITNSTDLSISDSIINLHSPSDLAPLVTNDGKDIGIKFHYYDTADSHAFIGRANDTGYLEWYDKGNDAAGIFTGTSYGTIKTGNIILTGNTYRGSTSNLTNTPLYKASSTAPTSPLVGDQWYDTSTDTLYEWFTDGTSSFWIDVLGKPAGINFSSQTSAPSGAKTGDYWYDTSTDTLYTYIYDGLSYNWVDFSSKQPAPATSSSATAGTTNLSTSVSGVLGVPYGGTGSTSLTSGAVLVGTGVSAVTASQLRVDSITGNLVIPSTTTSSSTTTGALVVGGGVGVAGNLNASNVVASSGFTIGSQVFYAQGTDGFSVNENFDPSNNSGQTAYHFASGATRANIAFTLARTGQFTDGFGVYGTSADNTFVTFGEQSNTSFEWRKGIGIQPLNLSGGTQLMKLSSAGNLVIPTATASASNTTGALVVGGGVGITGNINLVYNPVTAIGSAIQLTGKDTQGGIGWFDFLKATNTTSGATNPSKTFRLNSTGAVEIINSAYTSTLMLLSDAGAMSVSGSYQVNGKQAVNGPAFRAYIASGQAITSGSQQKVIFGSETFDTNSNFASSTFTPTVEGYYQLNATVRIEGNSGTGEVMITIWKNGSEYARGTNEGGTEQGANWYSMQVSDLAYANGSTDYFEIYIQQTSGGNRNTTAGTNISYFSGVMVRGA